MEEKMMPEENEALINIITDAFKDVQLEDGIGLSEADAIDSYKNSAEREACREKDEKQHWKAIPVDLLNEFYCSLSFFDAKGMKFHLPAYLIADIKREYKFGMVFVLSHLSDYSRSQFALLSGKQKQAVSLFLEYLLENPENEFDKPHIERAIKEYWLK